MKAAQRLLEYLAREGVSACFANPGTSEMHLVAAMDAVPAMRPILCLFEGVATGAADGFGRMAQQPAVTLLHLGPGLANGVANLHNAYRAGAPIVSLVGEHATYHRANNPPLATDILALARPVSHWMDTVQAPEQLVCSAAKALDAARQSGPALLIVPADVAWSDVEPALPDEPATMRSAGWTDMLDAAARALGPKTVLLLGGRRLSAKACAAAERIGAKTGAQVFVETFPARIERGGGCAPLKRLPYLSDMAAGLLSGAEIVVLAGAADPVAFFALPDRPTRLAPTAARIVEFARKTDDIESALEALAEAVRAPRVTPRESKPAPALPKPEGRVDPSSFAQIVAATLPENAIVSDESNTLGLYAFDAAAAAAPHDWLTLTGGSIGQGLPLATGAAVACPDRRVIALEADGSALYTIQALWTQAREQLNVTNLILNNGAYAILKLEMMRTGVTTQSHAAETLFELDRPAIDFTQIANGFGMPAERVRTNDALVAALQSSYSASGPRLIEIMFT